MKYHFIVLEGTHCAGKTTIAKELKSKHGFHALRTPPENYDMLRSYMHKQASGFSRFLFYLASIIDTSKIIENLLKTGPVVCDRYIYSTIAACNYDYKIEIDYLKSILGTVISEIILPSKTFLIKVNEFERITRLKKRGAFDTKIPLDQINNTDITRGKELEKIHEKYFYDPDNWIIINISHQSINESVANILNHLR
ncbi:MAG: deoxynucleoside kinase [Pseudomonadota bacterium]